MVSSAKTAIRNRYCAKIPRFSVLKWVIYNKIRTMCGMPIEFDKYIDYNTVLEDSRGPRRRTFLDDQVERTFQPKESRHYTQMENYFNR